MGAVILNFSTIRESRSSPLHTFNSQAAISVNSGRMTVESSIPCGISNLPSSAQNPQIWSPRPNLLAWNIKASSHIKGGVYTKPTLLSYEQSRRHSLGSSRVHSECARNASSLSLRLVSKRCPGRGSAANAKNASTPRLDTGNIGLNHQRESAIAPGLFALSLARRRFHKQ